MPYLNILRDIELLRLLQKPMNSFQVHKALGRYYSTTSLVLHKLGEMKLIEVVEIKPGPGPAPVKYYKITPKGMKVLKSFEANGNNNTDLGK